MKFGIGARLNIRIISIVVITMGILVTYFSIQSSTKEFNDLSAIIHNNSSKVAAHVVGQFNIDLGRTQSLASSFAGFSGYTQVQLKEMYAPFLKEGLENNPQYLAYWISLELKYFNPNFKDKPGRITWIYDRLSGKPIFRTEYRDTLGSTLSPQYQDIKKTKDESLIDPYIYNPRLFGLDVDSIYEATVGVPVLLNGEVVGLAGIDFTLDQFNVAIDSLKEQLKHSIGYLVSNNGTIVSTHDKKIIGSNISDLELFRNDGDFVKRSIQNGSDITANLRGTDGKKYFASFSPINIGKSKTPWSIFTVTPISIFSQQSNRVLFISLLIGLIGIAIIIILVVFFSMQVTRPIVKSSLALESLSTGSPNPDINFDHYSNDEIGMMANALTRLNQRFDAIVNFAQQIGKGNLEVVYPFDNEEDVMGHALVKMQKNLYDLDQKNKDEDWIKSGINGLNKAARGDLDLDRLSKKVIQYVSKYLDCPIGAIYIADPQNKQLRLGAGYAFSKRKDLNQTIAFGEGLIGQCAVEQDTICLTQVPDDYFPIKSATGATHPRFITVFPCLFQNDLQAILELGRLTDFTPIELNLLQSLAENIAISIHSSKAKENLNVLLAKTLEQKEELQAQEEELRSANQTLEKQTEELRRSEASLQTQQEELRVTNQELEKNAQLLEEQAEKISLKNKDLELAGKEINEKALALEQASKYKSEFLANMSHELRTPLNSLLILSQSLADNRNQTLSEDEIEAAQIIYKSGNDLLNLINEILDLSKIEAGKMTLNIGQVNLNFVSQNIYSLYKSTVAEKGVDWETVIDPKCPEKILSDQQRIEQVIKNLVSNAIKFTSKGKIEVRFKPVPADFAYQRDSLKGKTNIAIEVSDTGIGIPLPKQQAIFEAFQQADGTTSRRFGGTGLGLSISRELSRILGGEIHLQSTPGSGSCFTLIIPLKLGASDQNEFIKQEEEDTIPPVISSASLPVTKAAGSVGANSSPVNDDREKLTNGDHTILVIEDDPKFAKILYDSCHKQGFKCLVAGDGESGLSLARKYLPSAIILDISLPGIDGWKVLDQLKTDTVTRHIPVHMASGHEETPDAYQKGAIGFLQKPVTRESLTGAFDRITQFVEKSMKRLLIVEDDKVMRRTIKQLLKGTEVETLEVGSGTECMEILKKQEIDCMILDLGLPDMTGFELLNMMADFEDFRIPPVIIYTGRDLTREENDELARFTRHIIVKGVKSEERLLDETTLFLHSVVKDLPSHQQKILKKLYGQEEVLSGKKIMIVDDDMRNIFALTQIFEDKGIVVMKAENGLKAIQLLDEHPDQNLILMDIMMPEMDGYETMNKLRQDKRFTDTPIIALTAKAMKEDRQKCLDAGASDYLAKPVEISKLMSLLRVWLSK